MNKGHLVFPEPSACAVRGPWRWPHPGVRSIFLLAVTVLLLAFPVCAQTGFPFQDETLHYSVNWPSGLSLGDAIFTARHSAEGWKLNAGVDAGIPGFAISDKFWDSVTGGLCSLELNRDISHGTKKTREKTTFDQVNLTAHRVTVLPEGGGETDFAIPSCGRDALAFLYYARREMGQGHVAPPQQVYLGAAYSVRLDYKGARDVNVGDKPTVTDYVVVNVKGPKADVSADVYFARDAARTPLLIRIPLTVGVFSIELVR